MKINTQTHTIIQWFMQGTVPEGKTVRIRIFLRQTLHPSPINQRQILLSYFSRREKNESLLINLSRYVIWSGITAKDQVNKFVETPNLKSPRETLSDGLSLVYDMGHTMLGLIFWFSWRRPYHTSPCDLNTMLSTRPNVDGTRSFTVANVYRQSVIRQIVSHGSHNYENDAIRRETPLWCLDAVVWS